MRLIWFEAEGYKNFRSRVRMDELGSVNVIHGDNNAGKSNLIESIGVFFEALGLLSGQNETLSTGGLRLQIAPASTGKPQIAVPVFTQKLSLQNRLLGQPVREMFNIESRAAIRLAARLELKLEELADAGVDPAAEGEHEIELEISPYGHDQVLLGFGRWSHNGTAFIPNKGSKTGLTNPHSLFDYLARQCCFIPVGRDWLGSTSNTNTEQDPYSYRDRIPAELCLKLHDAEQETEPSKRDVWERFERAMGPFTDLLEGGRLVVKFDREAGRARLILEQSSSSRLPSYLLGVGIQQIITLIATLSSTAAPLVLLEEPEMNLRYTLQMRLRDAFLSLTRSDLSDARQFVLTTHSLGFENEASNGNAFFFGILKGIEGPRLERRPVGEAAIFTGNQQFTRPEGTEPLPPCWISNEGLVQVPSRILDILGLPQGGGVFFVQRKDSGHVELLTDKQFADIFESEGRDGDA